MEKKGYLLYAGISLLLASITLSLGLYTSASPLFQAWCGIVSGLSAWTISEMAQQAGLLEIEKKEGSLHFGMVLLLSLIAWMRLPVALQFTLAIFLMNWGGHIIIFAGREWVGEKKLTPISNRISMLIILGEVSYILIADENSLSRLWSATWIWIAVSMIVFSRLFQEKT
ncbi:MAG TPA: hypothetical protein EYP74_00895 [Anaerolineales bacterium]|nr:hypothetical protein [Anaerolineales bacterium]